MVITTKMVILTNLIIATHGCNFNPITVVSTTYFVGYNNHHGYINFYFLLCAMQDNELLSLCGLGDRKPSDLLRHIRSLNVDPKTLLCALFLARLPTEVRLVLAGSGKTDLDELAADADRILEASRTGNPSSFPGVSGVKNDKRHISESATSQSLCERRRVSATARIALLAIWSRPQMEEKFLC